MSNPQGESALMAALTSHLQSLQPCSQLNAMSIKLSEFWFTAPEVWFARTEAQFSTKTITQDQTKFDYVVSALDIKSAEEVQGFLINPPETEKYTNLKKNLINAFGKSQTQRDSELLNLIGLGDRKPTALLRKINSLNDDPATLKRGLFLSSIPPDVRRILAGQEFQDMKTLAEAADRIWEAHCAGRTGIQQVTQAGVEASPAAVETIKKKQINFHQNALEITVNNRYLSSVFLSPKIWPTSP